MGTILKVYMNKELSKRTYSADTLIITGDLPASGDTLEDKIEMVLKFYTENIR